MIYLDNAATTRIDDRILSSMFDVQRNRYGNPGSVHSVGQSAKELVDRSREIVGNYLYADADNIIFTSGGSESNTMAILGTREYLERIGKKHIVASSIEHHSVMAALNKMRTFGFDVTFVDPHTNGVVVAADVVNAIKDDTGLVCVMAVNNETGVQNEVEKIGPFCREYGVLFFTDCVQAAGTMRLNVGETGLCCDLLSLSSHKIHGPKGVGALYCRNREVLSPVIFGGNDQEYGLRGGTENVPGIYGFGMAVLETIRGFKQKNELISALKSSFYNALMAKLPEEYRERVSYNGLAPEDTGKVLSLTFRGVDAETLLMMMDADGVCASAGSACNSLEQVPSYVLKAIGLTDEEARSTIRFSFSKLNTEEEVTEAADVVARAVTFLIKIGNKETDVM